MAAFIKNKLKTARDSIGKKDYQTALSSATEVLFFEPSNYNARVFKGLALLELGRHDDSEQEYKVAIESNPDQLLAWQGLSKLYERTQRWEKYADSLKQLISMFAKSKDAVRCAETLQKLIDLRQESGSKAEIVTALKLLLPTSPLYTILSTLPEPDPTAPTSTTTYSIQVAIYNSLPILQEVVDLEEKEEDKLVRAEIDRRRMRLGASRGEDLKNEVGREVWTSSKLPSLYEEILNHPNTPDDVRREIETKLLSHRQRLLFSIPVTDTTQEFKSRLRNEVEDMVRGTVLLGIPDILAWNLLIESKDAGFIEEYDLSILRSYIRLYPPAPLSLLLKGYMAYMAIPITEDEGESDTENAGVEDSDDDPVDIVLTAFNDIEMQKSVIAHSIVSAVYSLEDDHENAIKISESSLELVARAEANFGKPFERVRKSFNITLAQALVHLYPPKHHPRALPLLENVLSQDPDNVSCLMARGYVLQFAEKWDAAESIYSHVIKIVGDTDTNVLLDAREQQAWSQIRKGDKDEGVKNLRSLIQLLDVEEGREEQKARAWWRLGQSIQQPSGQDQEPSYTCFITALKRSSTFAPAFTSLGIYYLELADPPDPGRASKCFQKAFELDAREGDAARRLAQGFADDREWDLVEVVAKRTIEGEGGIEGGNIGKSGGQLTVGRFSPTHAWAWRAVGVVELNRQNYASAIQAFQVALRADQTDFISWLRLGEAYAKSGKHVAAMKTLTHARELVPDDWTCEYLIGDVQRQMGLYEPAIAAFGVILESRPTESGILLSLAESHLALGREENSTGFVVRSERSFCSAISSSVRLIDSSPGFRSLAWKVLADSLFELSKFVEYTDPEAVRDTLSPVADTLVGDAASAQKVVKDSESMKSIRQQLSNAPDTSVVLRLCIASYDYRLSLSRRNGNTVGSALYDLSVALYTLSLTLDAGKRKTREDEAAQLVKEALRHDPGNEVYWNALAILNLESNPKLAQHAFIKALEFESKSPDLWTNLGLFYLCQNDVQLADAAFTRAQTLDPDYTLAWFSQGLAALQSEQPEKALALLEHAVGISADVPGADYEFSRRSFRSFLSLPPKSTLNLTLLHFPLFILKRYSQRRPDDPSALHLLGLICERFGQLDVAVELTERAISILEARYEESEDSETERRYVTANVNVGRLKLATSDFSGALEAFSTALSLSAVSESDVQLHVLRGQMRFGSGLASFKLGELGDALSMFETALEEIPSELKEVRGHVSVLLAQTLWAMGSDEARETAKSQLLECIAVDPSNLAAITTLAAMGTLTFDDSLVDAALSEILAMPLESRLLLDPAKDVDQLLIQHYLNKEQPSEARLVAQKAVHAEPMDALSRQNLASLLLQSGETEAAQHVASSPTLDIGGLETIEAELRLSAISRAGISPEPLSAEEKVERERSILKDVQKAVVLAPWVADNWTALAYVRSTCT